MRGSIPLSSAKLIKMSDKEALQEIVYITNHYVNKTDWWKRDREEYIEELINFIENNVIHCAMDNNYK